MALAPSWPADCKVARPQLPPLRAEHRRCAVEGSSASPCRERAAAERQIPRRRSASPHFNRVDRALQSPCPARRWRRLVPPLALAPAAPVAVMVMSCLSLGRHDVAGLGHRGDYKRVLGALPGVSSTSDRSCKPQRVAAEQSESLTAFVWAPTDRCSASSATVLGGETTSRQRDRTSVARRTRGERQVYCWITNCSSAGAAHCPGSMRRYTQRLNSSHSTATAVYSITGPARPPKVPATHQIETKKGITLMSMASKRPIATASSDRSAFGSLDIFRAPGKKPADFSRAYTARSRKSSD